MSTLEIILLCILPYLILSFLILAIVEKDSTVKTVLGKFFELFISIPIFLICLLVYPFQELVGRARRKRLKKKFEKEKEEEEKNGNKKTMEV